MKKETLLDFLVCASKEKLKEAALTRLAESSNRRKQIADSLDEWLGEALQAEMLSWMAAHREELAARLWEERNPFRLPERFNHPRNRGRWRRVICQR